MAAPSDEIDALVADCLAMAPDFQMSTEVPPLMHPAQQPMTIIRAEWTFDGRQFEIAVDAPGSGSTSEWTLRALGICQTYLRKLTQAPARLEAPR